MRRLQSLVGMFVALAVCLVSVTSAQAARYVKIEVLLDGKVLLEGNDSDDGHRDADQVWDALTSVNFKATDEFKKLMTKDDVQEVLLKSTTGSARGEQVNLQIDAMYGGTVVTHELHIKRVPVDRFGREWQLDAKELTKLFRYRTISRDQAAQLANPKRTK